MYNHGFQKIEKNQMIVDFLTKTISYFMGFT